MAQPNPNRGGSVPPTSSASGPSEPIRRALLRSATQALIELLPIGLRSLLPAASDSRPINSHDFSKLLAHINLPRFATGDTSLNWSRHFAKSLSKGARMRFAHHLAQAIEAGASPRSRLFDLHHAWWELVFMGSDADSRNPLSADDSVALLPANEISCRLGDPDIQTAMVRFRSSALDEETNGWNQRSLLSFLGYAVGVSGRPVSARRASLQACLLLPDQDLPIDQRDFWGNQATRRRGRAVMRMIRLFISLAEGRTHGDWSRACTDWRADLKWLESDLQITSN